MTFQDRAIDHAFGHWPFDLIEDTWQSVTQIILDDPTKLRLATRVTSGPGYPTTVGSLWVCLDRRYNDIHNDHSAPASELFANAVVAWTTNRLVAAELRGNRGCYTDYNCANCGGGLLLTTCSSCAVEFTDNHVRSGHFKPLATQLVTNLQSEGFTFAVDPAIAQQAERTRRAKAMEEAQARLQA